MSSQMPRQPQSVLAGKICPVERTTSPNNLFFAARSRDRGRPAPQFAAYRPRWTSRRLHLGAKTRGADAQRALRLDRAVREGEGGSGRVSFLSCIGFSGGAFFRGEMASEDDQTTRRLSAEIVGHARAFRESVARSPPRPVKLHVSSDDEDADLRSPLEHDQRSTGSTAGSSGDSLSYLCATTIEVGHGRSSTAQVQSDCSSMAGSSGPQR